MAFAPTPPRPYLPAQLLPLSSITSTAIPQTGGSSGSSGSITISSPPTTATAGVALLLAGTVSPSATAVRVGSSSSSATAPVSWTNATISGSGWTASLTPSSVGTIYIWAEQTATPSVQAISAAVMVGSAPFGSIGITTPPTTGTVGIALVLSGTVSPSATAVQVGLSSSAGTAPTSWTAASVSGTNWSATVTPSAAGTYYIWAEQSAAASVQVVSSAVVIASAGGSPLSYSLISGSGNASLTSLTLTTATSANYAPAPAVDWTSSIAHGSTDLQPNVVVSATGSISTAKFWFDANNTGVTPGNFGNTASTNNNAITFYSNATFATPTGAPAAPSAAGTYYGKYAFYSSSGTLLGVFTTSAITVT